MCFQSLQAAPSLQPLPHCGGTLTNLHLSLTRSEFPLNIGDYVGVFHFIEII